MLTPYRRLFSAPGTLRFSLAGFFARITMSTVGLGIVLVVSGVHGRYRLAGAVAATYSLVVAFVAPTVAGLADRRGQAVVLPVSAATFATGLIALIACTALGSPDWMLFPAVAVAGCGYAPVGSMIRTRWAALYGGTERLHVAYSLESVLDELIFIAGPVLITVLTTRVNRVAGLLTVLVLALAGMILLAVQRSTQPATGEGVGAGLGTVLRLPAVRVLMPVMLGLGALFGAMDLVTVAFASGAGQRWAGGVLLACCASGSAVAGLWYGSRQFRAPVHVRFVAGVAVMSAVTFLLLVPRSLPALAAVLFGLGLTIAPTLVSGVSLVEASVPRARLTEGMTWNQTALVLGVTAGSAIAGTAVDAVGPHLAYLTAVGGATLAAAAALGGARWLASPRLPT